MMVRSWSRTHNVGGKERVSGELVVSLEELFFLSLGRVRLY
jgi:hypothetical protein